MIGTADDRESEIQRLVAARDAAHLECKALREALENLLDHGSLQKVHDLAVEDSWVVSDTSVVDDAHQALAAIDGGEVSDQGSDWIEGSPTGTHKHGEVRDGG